MLTLMSRRTLGAVMLVALVACAPPEGPVQEEPPPAAPPPAAPPVTPEPVEETMTLTGCLERTEEQYALVVTEQTGEVMSGARFQVEPEPGVELEGHVGHTVRLTGTEPAAPAADERRFRVRSMQHVSAECQPPPTTE